MDGTAPRPRLVLGRSVLRDSAGMAGRQAEVRVSVMDPSVSGSALATLGEDLFVLSIRARDGKLMTGGRIDSALLATELIRLGGGRSGLDRWGPDRRPGSDRHRRRGTGRRAAQSRRAAFPPRPETWVGLPRARDPGRCAARLLSAGVLRLEPSRVLGGPRYQVTNASRVAAARSQLDAVTHSSGAHAAGRPAGRPADRDPADFAPVAQPGLASAIGLGDVLYPGRDGKARRARMAQIARQQVIATAAARGAARERVPPAGLAADPLAASLPLTRWPLTRWPLTRWPLTRWPGDGRGIGPRGRRRGKSGPGLAPAMDDVIAVAVHALTAVIDSSAIVGSEVVGTRLPRHPPRGRPGRQSQGRRSRGRRSRRRGGPRPPLRRQRAPLGGLFEIDAGETADRRIPWNHDAAFPIRRNPVGTDHVPIVRAARRQAGRGGHVLAHRRARTAWTRRATTTPTARELGRSGPRVNRRSASSPSRPGRTRSSRPRPRTCAAPRSWRTSGTPAPARTPWPTPTRSCRTAALRAQRRGAGPRRDGPAAGGPGRFGAGGRGDGQRAGLRADHRGDPAPRW